MKKRNSILFLFLGIFIVLFVIGTFFDFQISKAIVIRNNYFSLFFASIGEYPLYGGLAFFGGMVLVVALKQERIIFQIILSFSAFLMLLGGAYLQGSAFTSLNAWGILIDGFHKMYYSIPIGLLLVIPMFILGYFVFKKNDTKEGRIIIISIVIMMFLSGITPLILKQAFHRPRFRFVMTFDEILYYPWYKPFKDYVEFGKAYGKEEFLSFPSGHTLYSLMLMVLLYYMRVFIPKLKGKENMLLFVGFGYGLFIAFTRIFCGAHYLSDTAFSGIFITIVFLIGAMIIDKILEKKNLVI